MDAAKTHDLKGGYPYAIQSIFYLFCNMQISLNQSLGMHSVRCHLINTQDWFLTPGKLCKTWINIFCYALK